MRVHIGDVGPLPGVQGFECTPRLAVDRRNEYDSDETMLVTGLAEYGGNLEVLDIEKDTVFKALMGKKPSDPAVVDVLIENLNNLPIMLNVWNKEKTKFVKGYLTIGPTWSDTPYPTTVDGIVTMRMDYQATRGIKFPSSAVGFSVINVGGSPTLGPINPGGQGWAGAGRTPLRLSRKFQNNYVLCVAQRLADPNSETNEYTIKYLCWDSTQTSTTDLWLTDLPDANSQIICYYSYQSTNEAGGYVCSTV